MPIKILMFFKEVMFNGVRKIIKSAPKYITELEDLYDNRPISKEPMICYKCGEGIKKIPHYQLKNGKRYHLKCCNQSDTEYRQWYIVYYPDNN